jgi:hypothetical protein
MTGIRVGRFHGREVKNTTCDYAGVMAMTRNGLPLPLTISSGAARTIATVGGS